MQGTWAYLARTPGCTCTNSPHTNAPFKKLNPTWESSLRKAKLAGSQHARKIHTPPIPRARGLAVSSSQLCVVVLSGCMTVLTQLNPQWPSRRVLIFRSGQRNVPPWLGRRLPTFVDYQRWYFHSATFFRFGTYCSAAVFIAVAVAGQAGQVAKAPAPPSPPLYVSILLLLPVFWPSRLFNRMRGI